MLGTCSNSRMELTHQPSFFLFSSSFFAEMNLHYQVSYPISQVLETPACDSRLTVRSPRNETQDLVFARPALSQLSPSPSFYFLFMLRFSYPPAVCVTVGLL